MGCFSLVLVGFGMGSCCCCWFLSLVVCGCGVVVCRMLVCIVVGCRICGVRFFVRLFLWCWRLEVMGGLFLVGWVCRGR